jgi:hypothetical protein
MDDDDPQQTSDVAARSAAVARTRDVRRLALFDAAARALVTRSGEPPVTDVPATRRTFVQPRWIVFTILTWAFAVVAVRLGWWQLHVSDRKNFDLQNFSYWLQWWVFALCAVFFWARAIYLARRPPATERNGGIVVASSGGAIVRSGTRLGPEQPTGAVELVAPTSTPADPVVYRGYKIPTSADGPVRSHGDEYHNSYNDYLWQIAMADGETPDGQRES